MTLNTRQAARYIALISIVSCCVEGKNSPYLNSINNAFTVSNKNQTLATTGQYTSALGGGGSAVVERQSLQNGGSRSHRLSILGNGHHANVTDEFEMKNMGTAVLGDGTEETTSSKPPMRVLFLSADTGGGHRASAESLAKQFERLYPGTHYDLLDVWTEDGCIPYRTLVPAYKHLSRHPRQWRILYHISNSKPYEMFTDLHSWLACERKIRKRIQSYNPDVVISVHPTMNNVPIQCLKNMEKESGKHIPLFTVVTDFGSGHCTWFHKDAEKVFVASDRIRKLAKRRGSVPDSKLIQTGLPIRYDFARINDEMGDRNTPEGKLYQRQLRERLNINPDMKTVLVMGGGEGVGSLAKIVDSLYAEFTGRGIDCNICVICGRNEKLKQDLETRDWDAVVDASKRLLKRRYVAFLRPFVPVKRVRKSLLRAARKAKERNLDKERGESKRKGNVKVIGLGFITNMAEYMAASDVLLTKAGPGSIAEAAAVGLPCMLTSFLPGQEAGNVNVVLDGGFGDYCESPADIAEEVAFWLCDDSMLQNMSESAYQVGAPHASEEIVANIAESTLHCMALNEGKE